MFYYPVFGDAVKAQTVQCDLGGDKGSFAAIAAVVGAYVNGKEKAEEAASPSFGATWLTQDDLDELKEAKEGATDKVLVFPGICGGWADEADALGQATEVKGKTQVLFKFQGKVTKPAGDKLHVFARQFAKVDDLTEGADGKPWVVTLSDYTEHVFATVAEWTEATKKAGEVVAEVKEAVDEAKKDGEEEKKDDMAAAEGEGME